MNFKVFDGSTGELVDEPIDRNASAMVPVVGESWPLKDGVKTVAWVGFQLDPGAKKLFCIVVVR